MKVKSSTLTTCVMVMVATVVLVAVSVCCVLPTAVAANMTNNGHDVQQDNVELEQEQQPRYKKERSRKNLDDCIRTLAHIRTLPLLTTECCLTRLCKKGSTHTDADDGTTVVVKQLFHKLCEQNSFYLLRERSLGCVFKNDNNKNINDNSNDAVVVNNHTNFKAAKEMGGSLPAANCTGINANFQISDVVVGRGEQPTINDVAKTEETNDGAVIRDSIKTEASTLSANMPTSTRHTPHLKDDKKITFGSRNITESSARISGLQFLDVPRGDEMRIHDLRLGEEYLLFDAFSALMGYLHPDGFPSELMRHALENRIPFYVFAFQLLKTEIAAVGWILFWLILTISLPCILVAHFLCSGGSIQRLDEDGSDVSLDFRERCTKNTLGYLLHFLLMLVLIPIILILAGNEQISRMMAESVSISDLVFEDINSFIQNTHMQISFVATSSTDITVEAIRKDLEDVENLLGKPFQEVLSSEAGIDMALDELDDLKEATGKVTTLVSDLLDDCALARAAGSLLQEQLREIARQLTIARQQCQPKDRALCYTLQYAGFDVIFSCDNLTADTRIKHLRNIGREKDFNNSVEIARATFVEVPERVSLETAQHITDLKTLLSRKRTEVYKSVHSLDELARALSESVSASRGRALQTVEIISNLDLWRWLSILGISTILSLVWGLLLCGAPCGCGVTSRTVPLLLSGVSVSALMCLVVWSMGALSFLVGGHGQTLLCQPLYEQPHYRTLRTLLDPGGILYGDDGIFKALIRENDTLSVSEILNKCQRNQPAYFTFHLHNVFDAKSVTNYKSWDDLAAVIGNFTIRGSSREHHHQPDDGWKLEMLSPTLQLNLQVLSTVSSANLTEHRAKISGPLTRRDLTSFADQLNTVARQLNDMASSRRIDRLALNVKKIIHNEMQRLNDLRYRILYKITALEVIIRPLSEQANQTLAKFKEMQYFLDNKASHFAEKSTKRFTSRIEDHLDELNEHILVKVTKELGKCRPLWEIFHSTRFCICRLIVNPMNGISLCSFFMVMLFLVIAPVVFKLVEHYRDLNDELLTSITHRRARDGLLINDEGTWVSPEPSSVTPADVEMRNVAKHSASPWTSPGPRQPSEPRIPPPSKLSIIASRMSGSSTQIPSTSRARSSKRGRHDSLRLVEPVCWKSGSFSPRSWI